MKIARKFLCCSQLEGVEIEVFPVKMLQPVLVLVYKDVCNSGVDYTAS